MNVFNSRDGISVRAYKGDAMTLLAFDLEVGKRINLAGFTICYRLNPDTEKKYIYNRLTFPDDLLEQSNIPGNDKHSTLYSPIQKFNWVHVPNTDINTQDVVFGDYIYEITPRYIENYKLKEINNAFTVTIEINVSPFNINNTKIGFTRGFVSSVAYAKRFNAKNSSVRPNENELIFDILQKADTAKRYNKDNHRYDDVDYTYEEQHKWLGWQARERIIEFLDEAINSNLQLKVFAYDLDEPEISKRLSTLAKKGHLKIILDNDGKDIGDHGNDNSYEGKFNALFNEKKTDGSEIVRGKYKGLAHCKVFIMLDPEGEPSKVLTGSTNFSTNGLYINSNHVVVFDNTKIAALYNNLFDNSFSVSKIKNLKGNPPTQLDYVFSETEIPNMTITFAPHTEIDAKRIFDRITTRITQNGNTDLLFAIMKDTSESSILKAVRKQLKNASVFTYGITDTISKKADDYEVFLYKPNYVNGIRVAAKGISNVLPEPFGTVPKVSGYAIHHKFVVVNFRGNDPVVYCGSSNLAFGPEQRNGDNLLEIHDEDMVTAFAIEALRLVDHFHWRNYEIDPSKKRFLDDLTNSNKIWYQSWFNVSDLKSRQRELYIK